LVGASLAAARPYEKSPAITYRQGTNLHFLSNSGGAEVATSVASEVWPAALLGTALVALQAVLLLTE